MYYKYASKRCVWKFKWSKTNSYNKKKKLLQGTSPTRNDAPIVYLDIHLVVGKKYYNFYWSDVSAR